ALRLLLHKLNSELSLKEIRMHPILAYYADHYVRAYIHVKRGPSSINLTKIAYIEHCFNCLYRGIVSKLEELNKNCPECGSRLSYAGPLWAGGLADSSYLEKLLNLREFEYLKTFKRSTKLFTLLKEENGMPIGYLNLHTIADLLGVKVPKLQKIIQTLSELGYRVSKTHFNSVSIKTNATVKTVGKILKELSSK
ncbi:MAG: hypothetical protein ACTSYQ_00200, partial [Candidatus Odinarchaeia archaeon]